MYFWTKMEEKKYFYQVWHLKIIVKKILIPTLPNFFQTIAQHTEQWGFFWPKGL